ncbi:unnamed protein product [Prunus armeniaca]
MPPTIKAEPKQAMSTKVWWCGDEETRTTDIPLQTFDLYDNQFLGSIPTAIFNLSALRTIDLGNNELSGIIPREIGNLTMPKEIHLYSNNFKGDNKLSGTIPSFISNGSNKLTRLDINANLFFGFIPTTLCLYKPSVA